MTHTKGYPFAAHTMARPMPVLPEDASTTVWPGFSSPFFSAHSMQPIARRSGSKEEEKKSCTIEKGMYMDQRRKKPKLLRSESLTPPLAEFDSLRLLGLHSRKKTISLCRIYHFLSNTFDATHGVEHFALDVHIHAWCGHRFGGKLDQGSVPNSSQHRVMKQRRCRRSCSQGTLVAPHVVQIGSEKGPRISGSQFKVGVIPENT